MSSRITDCKDIYYFQVLLLVPAKGLKKENTIVTQTYQILTKHTQQRNKLIIHILYRQSHTIKKQWHNT